ncbi:4Fe-4S binding protein [bacterium]|nr:4Fe-4S binding protein [bacterium]
MQLNNKILKFISGAGNENFENIKRYSYIFIKAGFDVIDVSPLKNSIQAVHDAEKLAEKDIKLCVSVGLGDDIHFNKAQLLPHLCNKCLNCVSSCPQLAIDNEVIINQSDCIGCMKCVNVCPNSAIKMISNENTPIFQLNNVLSEKFDMLEFHCISSDISLIKNSYKQLKEIFSGEIGICLNRSKLNKNQIVDLLSEISDGNKLIVQADGKSMSGGSDDLYSSVEAVDFAKELRQSNLNLYLILSGGTNSRTSELAYKNDVNIDGIALGSYARKFVHPYIICEDFWENKTIQDNAVQRVLQLADELRKY